MAEKSGDYAVVWPSGERRLKVRPLARRLDTLNGKKVAQLWDYLFAGDEVFSALRDGQGLSANRMGIMARIRLDPRGQREGSSRLTAAALQGNGS